MPTFSAVLLAGGRSRRMGRDKALLSVPGSELLLGQRQLSVLEELAPEEIFWSGPARPGVPSSVRLIADEVEDAGPLAGISACLSVLRSDLLVVLAIDLPRMNAAFLRTLLAQCSSSRGVVTRNADYFEPLAAIYPKSLHTLAREHLRQKRYALQEFIREAMRQGRLEEVPPREGEALLFKNVNSPEDLSDI
jgi:molybdopterin-guanine dinucleotide biosynthesis protein A